jgi:hypothetical protein
MALDLVIDTNPVDPCTNPLRRFIAGLGGKAKAASETPLAHELRRQRRQTSRLAPEAELTPKSPAIAGRFQSYGEDFSWIMLTSAPNPRTGAAALRVGLLCLEKATTERLDA